MSPGFRSAVGARQRHALKPTDPRRRRVPSTRSAACSAACVTHGTCARWARRRNFTPRSLLS